MTINEGDTVSIKGSDTLWIVTEVDKWVCQLVDKAMQVICLEDVPLSDILEVLEDDV